MMEHKQSVTHSRKNTSFTKFVSFHMNIIELMSNGQDQIVLILIFINPTT